ncbi:hypothetical protein DFJ58DRAFT_242761 [Suillus subalutaceus]|uniref:uncharacterized protein n=1 Tax=Suillus subalutaceus TaxID=48586 RepID=UPI001B863D0A|nr:uncharacterized protein DFJ58DRAFT_242761 [Suillus subalutaceus]KAG1831965.1 hypothetical protein DFJ58DRAFT_242761 [Suillus subalutaceus]
MTSTHTVVKYLLTTSLAGIGVIFKFAMALIPLDTAFLVSSVLVGILYGFSVFMFVGTIWTFTYKHRTRDVNRPMAAVATLLFLLSTADMVLVIIQVEDGLVKYRDAYPGGPETFFANFRQETFIAKNVIYTLQTLLGDGVVIYRCYALWQSVWVIILPCILWCGIAAFGICWVYAPRSIPPGPLDQTVFASDFGIWITAFLTFTLATYLFSSGLVVYHIWTVERKVSAVYVAKPKMPILRVLIDAASLYSAALCPFIIIYYAYSSAVFYVMGDMLIPIISIVFYTVFIRIAINKHTQDGETSETGRITTLQFCIQSLQSRSEQNDLSSWPTAQK